MTTPDLDLRDDVVDIYEETPEQAFKRRQQYLGSARLGRTHRAPISRIFLWCAGVDVDVLRMCPHESPKYVALGGSVAVAAVLSGVSLGLALSQTSSTPQSLIIVATLFWTFANLNLDRWLMASDIGGPWGERSLVGRIAPLLVRGTIAFVLSLVVSVPIVLSVFRSEITYQLENDFNRQVSERAAPLDSELARTDRQIQRLQLRLYEEIEGMGGQGVPGAGPRVHELRLLIRDLEKRYDGLERDRERTIMATPRAEGLLARMDALSRLSDSSPSVKLATTTVQFFLILVFLAPGLLAFFSAFKMDTYHALLELRVREIVATARAQLRLVEVEAEAQATRRRETAELETPQE